MRVKLDARVFAGVPTGSCYFVHSYHLRCAHASDAVAWIEFGGGPVTAAVERGNVFGTQFHPEKSQDIGLAVLDNYSASPRRFRHDVDLTAMCVPTLSHLDA